MSKTFMTATGANRQLQIKRSDDAVMIRHYDPEFSTQQIKTFFLNPSDAPALALAVLEAAGAEAKPSNDDPGTPGNLGRLAYQLMIHIDDAEKVTAEAKDKAELEAEALELMNVRLGAAGNSDHLTKETVDPIALEAWISVARRAREMRAEK